MKCQEFPIEQPVVLQIIRQDAFDLASELFDEESSAMGSSHPGSLVEVAVSLRFGPRAPVKLQALGIRRARPCLNIEPPVQNWELYAHIKEELRIDQQLSLAAISQRPGAWSIGSFRS